MTSSRASLKERQRPPQLRYRLPSVLSCLDGYMNIALEQTVEYVDGVKKNSYGDAFIRGNNGKLQLQMLFL